MDELEKELIAKRARAKALNPHPTRWLNEPPGACDKEHEYEFEWLTLLKEIKELEARRDILSSKS